MTDFTASDDIKAGQLVHVRMSNLVFLHTDDCASDCETFVLDQDVKKGDHITYFLSPQPLRLVPSLLNQKEWAVLTDDSQHLDLTYQEAKQLEMALVAQKAKGVVVVTNAAGKRARENGFLRTADQN